MEDRTGALLVAQRAVVEMQGKNFVWVVDDTNKASMRSVTVGPRIGSEWLIDTGLKPGDRVVVEGLQMLTEGGSVQPAAARPRRVRHQPANKRMRLPFTVHRLAFGVRRCTRSASRLDETIASENQPNAYPC